MKVFTSILLTLCLCLPARAEKRTSRLDDEIEQAVRNAISEIEIQIPEILKAVRVKVDLSEIQVHVPAVNVHLPEVQLPEVRLDAPVNVQIPAILIPKIRVQIPPIDIQIPKTSE